MGRKILDREDRSDHGVLCAARPQAFAGLESATLHFSRRIEQFHDREFQGQSTLKVDVQPEPFRSVRTTEQLRDGDANFVFSQTLNEVDERLHIGRGERAGFPVLLVLSDINWRPLDDFFRVKPSGDGSWKPGLLRQWSAFPRS